MKGHSRGYAAFVDVADRRCIVSWFGGEMVDHKQQPRAVDCPEPCFVRLRIVKNGPPLAARIFKRLGMLCGEINGAEASVDQIWHGGVFITEEQYAEMMETPHPEPSTPIDLGTMEPVW